MEAGGARVLLRHSTGKSVKKGEDAFAVQAQGVWRYGAKEQASCEAFPFPSLRPCP